MNSGAGLVASSAQLVDEWVMSFGTANMTVVISEFGKATPFMETLMKVGEDDIREINSVLLPMLPLFDFSESSVEHTSFNPLVARDMTPILETLERDVLPELDPLKLKDWPNFIRNTLYNVSKVIDPSIEFLNASTPAPK